MKTNPEDYDSNTESNCSKNCLCNQGANRNNDWRDLLIFVGLVGGLVLLVLCFWR